MQISRLTAEMSSWKSRSYRPLQWRIRKDIYVIQHFRYINNLSLIESKRIRNQMGLVAPILQDVILTLKTKLIL